MSAPLVGLLIALVEAAAGRTTAKAGTIPLSSLRSDCHLAEDLDERNRVVVWLECKGAAQLRLNGTDALEGAVSITSADQALEFVRLFTTEGRWRYLEYRQQEAEPLPASKADWSRFLVSHRVFKQCCRAPTAEGAGTASEFIIRRYLVNAAYEVWDVTQWVKRNGVVVTERSRINLDGSRLGGFLADH